MTSPSAHAADQYADTTGRLDAYLDSLGREPMTPAQRQAARAYVDERITQDGWFGVRKHTVLITAG